MAKIEKVITDIMGYLIAALIFIMMVDIFAEVIVRYILKTSLSFSEELGRYLFVWIVFIGMSRCVAYEKHVALDLLPRALKGSAKKILLIVINILQIVFFYAVTRGGIALYQIGLKQKSATMRIPMNLVYVCIPICGICSIFFIILQLADILKGQKGTDKS
jgi:TRAP-type C4-dicarboxylate transport system permease small subunit